MDRQPPNRDFGSRGPRREFGNRPPRGGRPGGGGRSFGGGGGGRGGRGKPPAPPMLLGEPSPALAKIATMNIVKLEAKILSLKEEQERLAKRIERLVRQDPQPAEQIENLRMQLARLLAIEQAAKDRLTLKLERKARWDAKEGNV